MVEGNVQHKYKEALTRLEEQSPGTKHQMYFGFLKRAADRFDEDREAGELVACADCGAPTVLWEQGVDAVCSFCKTKALATKRKEEGTSAPRRRRRSHR